MELKATLNKPFTDVQYADFIVVNNHNKGYQIKETEMTLEAWGYTDEEIAQQENEHHKIELISQLDIIDLKTIRALRAIQSGLSTEEDEDRLLELEYQAQQIRQELKEL